MLLRSMEREFSSLRQGIRKLKSSMGFDPTMDNAEVIEDGPCY
jgi:hypothetical protein